VVIHHRRRSSDSGADYVRIALKILAVIGLLGALHGDPVHAVVYVPAIVAVSISHKLGI
jgi:hypothetical protein